MTGNKEGETFANKKEKRPAANAADSPFYRHTGTWSRLGVVVMSMRGPGSASANWPAQIRLLPPRVIPSSGKTNLPWFAGICQAARAFFPRRAKVSLFSDERLNSRFFQRYPHTHGSAVCTV